MALPNPFEGQELVVGVVSPADFPKLPRGDGASLPKLGWVTLGRALGAGSIQFVMILNLVVRGYQSPPS